MIRARMLDFPGVALPCFISSGLVACFEDPQEKKCKTRDDYGVGHTEQAGLSRGKLSHWVMDGVPELQRKELRHIRAA